MLQNRINITYTAAELIAFDAALTTEVGALPTLAVESVKVTKKSFQLMLLAKGRLTFQIKDITPLVEQFR